MFRKKENSKKEREKMKEVNTLPQEIEVWYIIPAIRKEMAKTFSKDYNLSYDKIAFMMGLTKSAISHYIAGKRVEKIRLHPKALEELKKSCKRIVNKKSKVVTEIKKILDLIHKEKLHCEICGAIIDEKGHDCKEIYIPKKIINY